METTSLLVSECIEIANVFIVLLDHCNNVFDLYYCTQFNCC